MGSRQSSSGPAASSVSGAAKADAYLRIYEVVRQIPRGRVATYGQVARWARLARQARMVGYALHALRADDVPWQRVINARGQISRRSLSGSEIAQRELLEAEGVEFDARGRVDLGRFGWDGPARSAAADQP